MEQQDPPEFHRGKLTWTLIGSTLCVVLGAFQFGYNTGVINSPKDVIIESYRKEGVDVSNFEWGLIVAMFAIGGMCGGLSGGELTRRFGRKWTLYSSNILFLIAGPLMAVTTDVVSFVAGRFVVGVGCGLATIVVPMYLSESAPVNLRGAFGTLNQLGVTTGILISQAMGMEETLGTHDGWRWLIAFTVVPAALQLLLFWQFPDTPMYQVTKGNIDAAKSSMRKFRGKSHRIDEEIASLIRERDSNTTEKTGLHYLLHNKQFRVPILIAVVLQMGQQFSGINGIFNYSTTIFQDAGVENSSLATTLVGIVNVLCTVLSVWLMDRAGRRSLLLWGFGGMVTTYTLITISLYLKESYDWMNYVLIVFIVFTVIFFAIGPGSIPWLIVAELFPVTVRSSAMAISVGVNWFSNFIVGLTFLPLKDALNDALFIPFAVLCTSFCVFTFALLPETKGKTIDQIEKLFQKRSSVNEPLLQ